MNSWLWWIFKFTKFLGHAPKLNFINLKIHYNQLFIMTFSHWDQNLKRKIYFFEKCKQTAEISWHFFSYASKHIKYVYQNTYIFNAEFKNNVLKSVCQIKREKKLICQIRTSSKNKNFIVKILSARGQLRWTSTF